MLIWLGGVRGILMSALSSFEWSYTCAVIYIFRALIKVYQRNLLALNRIIRLNPSLDHRVTLLKNNFQ
jgi:hypothetical protein